MDDISFIKETLERLNIDPKKLIEINSQKIKLLEEKVKHHEHQIRWHGVCLAQTQKDLTQVKAETQQLQGAIDFKKQSKEPS